MNQHLDQDAVADLVIPLKGAAASVILALLFFGGSMTAKELELTTGYSDKPVTRALTYLERKRYVQNNGQLTGWSIRIGSQLPLPLTQMVTSAAQPGIRANGMAKLDTGKGRVAQPDAGTPEEDRNISEDRNFSDLSPSSSSSLIYKDIKSKQKEEEEERPEDRNISDLRALLITAGIGIRSPVLQELLDLDYDPAYVEAHVLARKTALSRGETFPVNWLITKLRCGDPAPAPTRDRLQNQIPDNLRDIISR